MIYELRDLMSHRHAMRLRWPYTPTRWRMPGWFSYQSYSVTLWFPLECLYFKRPLKMIYTHTDHVIKCRA